MTLSIATIFPPDEFMGFSYRNMPFRYPAGVVLVSDSRLTYFPGGQRDIGNKVFPVVPGIALAYAGNVAIADLATRRLAKVISKHHMSSPIHKIRHVFSNVFRKAYTIYHSSQSRLEERQLRTHFLVACYSQSKDEPYLTQYTSPGFQPVVKRGVSVIGSSEAVRARYLEHVQAAVKRSHSWPGSTTGMAAILASVLGEIIDLQIDPGVGGFPEAAVIDATGTRPLYYAVLDEEMNKLHEVSQEGTGWVKKNAQGVPISRTGIPPYGA